MSEFIVLGLIPGTHIQITFVLWSILVLGAVTACLAGPVRRAKALQSWIVTIYLLLVLKRTVLQPE
jgi:hypothetical protein